VFTCINIYDLFKIYLLIKTIICHLYSNYFFYGCCCCCCYWLLFYSVRAGGHTVGRAGVFSLPCFVVVRLCTDEQRVTDYWNRIEASLEVELDVIDDLHGNQN
jgi:hypothetical protein